MIYTVKQGSHDFRPSVWKNIFWKKKAIKWECMFYDSCIYDHGDSDQKDWNKLAGISFCLWTNHKNSIMVGWRWNIDEQVFELAKYCHVDGKRVMGETLLKVNKDEYFTIEIYVDYRNKVAEVAVNYNDITYNDSEEFKALGSIQREIGAWFGGNRTAPHSMTLEKN